MWFKRRRCVPLAGKIAPPAGCVGATMPSGSNCLMGVTFWRQAAEPAALSARSVGIRAEKAERRNPVEQPVGARWGLYLRLPALGAGRRGMLLPQKRGPREFSAAARACIRDGWHDVAITVRRLSVNRPSAGFPKRLIFATRRPLAHASACGPRMGSWLQIRRALHLILRPKLVG